MHKLLVRQLRRAGVQPEALAPELAHLLELVDDAYRAADADRALAERSLELTSQELVERHRLLQEELSTREAAQVALRASEERYRVIFDASPLAILVFEAGSLRVTECNAAALALYGYTRDELTTKRLTDLKDDPDDPELSRVPKAPSETWTGTKTHRKKGGTPIQVAITAHSVTLDGRQVVLAMEANVTETRRLEELLRQSQKMEAVGLLAGGIAHDFNNIIATILSYVDLASASVVPASQLADDIAEIGKAARRAAGLTQQLLAFSRKQPCRPKVVALDTIVAGMHRMLRRVLGEDIALSTSFASASWSVLADRGMLEQVILNLAVNARDAMPRGGTLIIGTRNEVVEDISATALEIKPGDHVVLSVSDTGCGMDEATQSRVFEPFFTTKPVGKGTGLGLAMVFGIVKQSGGAITVRSRAGEGSEFSVYLPRVRTHDSQKSLPPITLAETGTETVLVVEDDQQVQTAVCRLLAARGYRVLRARGSRQALEALVREGASIDVLLTDIVMPEMDGRSLAVRAVQMHPSLKVVFMSGHTEHPAASPTELGPSELLVRKPFSPQQLTRAVRLAIDSDPYANA